MKKILLALVAVILMASFASASVLVPANTLGAGKWGYLGAAGYAMNSVANSNSYSIGGFGAYGVMDNLDVYVKAGYGLPANAVAGVTMNAIQLGLAAKYLIVSESKDMPVSVAALAGYQTTTTNMTAPITTQFALGDLGAGVVVSKVMVPWVPYGAAVYHSLNDGTTTGSNVEVAIGTQMLLSKSSAIVGEFSYNSISMGGTSTESKISLAYSAKI
jgi:opacity protein-like surface antigen